MNFKNFFKRGLCIIMAVIVLALSPIGSYMDTQSIQTVHASAVTLGGSLLFQMISGLHGVLVADNQLENEYNSFKDYLANDFTDVKEYFESITPETVTIQLTARVLQVVNSFLDLTAKAQGLVNGITGGSVASIPSDTAIYCGSSYNNNATAQLLREFILNETDIPNKFIAVSNLYTGSPDYFSVYYIPQVYIDNDQGCTYISFPANSNGYLYLKQYKADGSSINNGYYRFERVYIYYNAASGSFTFNGKIPNNANNYSFSASDVKSYCLISSYPLRVGNGYSQTALSDFLNGTTVYTPSSQDIVYTVTGNYSTQNIANVTDKELTASQVISINNAVNQGFADNTTTDENGNLVYTDDMANIIADLVAQKLIAEGIVSNENTGDNTGDNTGGNTGTIDTSSIVDVLQSILSQIMGLTAVGGYFDKVINGLDKIGLWDIDVWFTNLLEGVASISASINDIRTGQVSIDDIKVNISDWLISIDTSMKDFLSRTWTTDDIKDWFATTQIGEKLDALRDRTDIKEWVDSLKEAITNTTELGLLGILQRILSAILSLPLSIAQAIMDLLADLLRELFVPDTTAFEQAVNDLRNEFGFADSVMTIWDDIFARLKRGNEPPKIYIHFENSEDERFRSIGKMLAIDFAWYEKYKPFGDSVISAILWAFFLLRLIKGIPNIIKGASTGDVKPDVADPDIGSSLVVQKDQKPF